MTGTPHLSVVIPFYNEQECAGDLVAEVIGVLRGMDVSWELVLVDDGSADETLEVLRQAQRECPECRILHQARNAGQAAALWNGLHATRGAVLATLDGDGQNDPADLPMLLRDLAGADMVVGVRAGRQDSSLRRAMSRVANRVRGRWLNDRVSDTGCALKVFRRAVLDAFLPIRTLYSFMPAFAVAAGYRVIERPVHHRPRTAGTSKYGLLVMLWRPFVDMLALGWVLQRRIPRVETRELEQGSSREAD